MCQMVSSIYTCKFVNLPVPLKYKQKYIPFVPNKPGHLRYREGGKGKQLVSQLWVLKNAKTQFCVSTLRLSKSHAKRVWTEGPEGDFVGCKHFKVFLQFFYGNEANSYKSLKNKRNLSN